ncbi:MAG: hypothetical protein FWH07_06340 [Oscillospiraceae bacterium]|nr:hypothetical protein [Oscillospiraceae bacterium]
MFVVRRGIPALGRGVNTVIFSPNTAGSFGRKPARHGWRIIRHIARMIHHVHDVFQNLKNIENVGFAAVIGESVDFLLEIGQRNHRNDVLKYLQHVKNIVLICDGICRLERRLIAECGRCREEHGEKQRA